MARFMRFRCPGCQVSIKASYRLRGQTHGCPKCKHQFVVHAEPPEDAGPILVQEEFTPVPTPAPAEVF